MPAHRTSKSSARAIVWALVLAALGCLMYFVVIPIGIENPAYATQSPRLFPNVVSLLIAALSFVLIAVQLVSPARDELEAVTARFLVIPALAAAYAVLFGAVGFVLTSALALAAMLVLFGERRWPVVLAISSLVSAGVYGVFVHLFRIPLPAGILG